MPRRIQIRMACQRCRKKRAKVSRGPSRLVRPIMPIHAACPLAGLVSLIERASVTARHRAKDATRPARDASTTTRDASPKTTSGPRSTVSGAATRSTTDCCAPSAPSRTSRPATPLSRTWSRAPSPAAPFCRSWPTRTVKTAGGRPTGADSSRRPPPPAPSATTPSARTA